MIVTLTTDFGCTDGFAGILKGVILGIAPAVNVVDITHDIKQFDVQAAAWVLSNSYKYFPKGSVHVVVVDPGVGSSRKGIVLDAGDHIFVGPDNGVFSYIIERAGQCAAFELSHPEYWLPEVSTSFHGRDIFAPVAAHLSRGVHADRLGHKVEPDELVRFRIQKAATISGEVIGNVVYIDQFGNLITNIAAADMIAPRHWCIVNEIDLGPVGSCYSSAHQGHATSFLGSHGYLEIGVFKGRADNHLGASVGTQVVVRPSEEG